MIGRDSLTLAAAVAESAQEREKESEACQEPFGSRLAANSQVDLSWEPLHRKVQEQKRELKHQKKPGMPCEDYVNTELAASLMVSSRLMELGTRVLGAVPQRISRKHALLGSSK